MSDSLGHAAQQQQQEHHQPRDVSMESNNYTIYYQLGTDERHHLDKQIHDDIERERVTRQQEELRKECPFRPNIDRNSKQLVHNKKYTALGDGDVSKRLLERAHIMEMERQRAAEERERREQLRLQHEAPFRPTIDETSAKTSRRMFDGGEAVEDRLLEYGKKTKEALAKRQLLKEEHEQLYQSRAFNPRVNSNNNNIRRDEDAAADDGHEGGNGGGAGGAKKQKSFLARALEKQNERAVKLADARAADVDQCTFQPSTNHISGRLDAERQAESNAAVGDNASTRRSRTDQLYNDAKRLREHSEQRQRNRQLEESSHDHRPRVLQVSERIIKHGRNAQIFQENFVTRQEEFQQMKEEAHRRAQVRIAQEERTAAGRNEKTFVDEHQAEMKAQELYAKRKIKERARRELQSQLQQEECPFRPEISVGSARLNQHKKEQVGHAPGVVERLSATPRSRSRSAQPAHSVNDSLNDSVQSTVSIRAVEDFLERQKDSEARKAAKIQGLQAEREMGDLQGCTFRPRIASNTTHAMVQRSRSHDPRASIKRVNGVGNHVQRQQDARRKADDRKSRVDHLGEGVPCNGPNYTVVMPFNLSSGRPDSFRSPAKKNAKTTTQQQQHHPAAVGGGAAAAGMSYQRLQNNKVPGARKQPAAAAASTHPSDNGAAASYTDPLAANKLMEAIKRHTSGAAKRSSSAAVNSSSIYA